MSKSTEIKENKMGYMPINKLLLSMSLPMVLSMLVQALYNIVDSIFVAQISENALSAVSLAFPIQNLMIAVGSGTGVGINALLSRNLGEQNFEDANKAAMNGILLIGISYVLFMVFGVFFAESFFLMQTNDIEIVQYGTSYLSICSIFSFGLFMQMTFERLLQSTGKTVYSMISQGVGAIINIIMDPILIFGLLGFPKLGVAGAAIATVLGQIIGMFVGLYFNLAKNKEIHFSLKNMKPQKETLLSIFSVGIPSVLMISIGSVMTYGVNKILLFFSSTAVSVFGVYFRLQSFIFMPVFGLNNGMIPIIAYNYGAKHKKRIMDTIKSSVYAAMGIMFIGFLIFQVFPKQLLGLFNASSDMITIGVPALRIISISFVFAGFCIVLGSVYQALGNGFLSLIVSITRQIIFILPLAYIFAKAYGLSKVWYAIPIAEIVSVILNIFFFKYIYQKKIK